MIYKHAGFQLGVALLAFTMWAAADSWHLLTGLAIANALSLVTAILAGLAVSTVVHEWSHFAGARFSHSSYRIPKKLGFFVYDFDFEKNSLRQFNLMSLSGQAGSWATVIALVMLIPLDSSGRIMLVASAVGSAVYGGLIEWPVLKRSQQSGKPAQELRRIDARLLKRSGIAAAATTGAIFMLLG